MGIPKFYRWTSERYPCLYERIREYQIPEFDNLYLDMNGIIHNCSHPNDEDVHLRIPEENIFRDIFHYIDFLFRMIKPCKVFFMAVDGVAPRAKMNQQRGRRFRSARVAEEQEAEALRQGEKLPSEERFDSNCITPGTEFMARLHEQLKYFVAVKISTDPLWQRKGVCVYLSGHDVPGEGEHKIMDFIRHIRSQPDYDPETRHCLYGLDADLMMLGLSTHELRFALLREEVKFTKPKKKKPAKNAMPKKPKFKVGKIDDPPVKYDLTNVSVFSSEANLGLANLNANVSAGAIGPSVGTLVTDKSFVDAINVVPLPIEKVARSPVLGDDTNAPPPPPPTNDHLAKGDYKAPLPEKTTFFLLHLSLFRDYLDEEFKELRDILKDHPVIKYDLECLIDDWILMNILVGNDFVPHLPNLHIVKGALPMLYRTYMDVLPTLDGYLNESGILNLQRFEVFITRLSQFDLDMFRETYDDMKYKASKTGKNIVLGEKMFEDFIFEDNVPFVEDELEPISDELRELTKRTEDEIFGVEENPGNGLVCKEVFPEDRDFFAPEDTEEFKLEFLQHKRNYYLTKCEFRKVDRDAVHEFAREYVRAIQWVLLYYYKGVSSWGWFYPSHYAPFSSDLRRFGDFKIEFDKGQPFKPFEQLLAVLPSQSKKLLPGCYQWLMTEDASPILEYYPKKFELDLNGKRQDWEAVVLIPFIDELKLLHAMEHEFKKLSEEEVFRNLRGSLLKYSYTSEPGGAVKSHRDIFPELPVSHAKIEKFEEVLYNPALLPKGVHPKADIKKIYQGFPSLKSKTFESCIMKAEVKVFEFYAREESLILSFENVEEEVDVLKLGKKVLGKTVWVNWPHLESALVSALYTRQGKYILGRDNNVIKDPKGEDAARKTFELMANGLTDRHLKFRGIKLGKIDVILFAKLMEGRKIRCNKVGKVVIENQWSQNEQPFALRTAIYEERVTEMFFMDDATAKTYMDLFKKGDQVFYLGDKLFGAMGVVTGHDKGTGCVVVELVYPKENDESNLKLKTGMSKLKSQDFFPPYVAATKCQISSFALSRLTGRVLVSVERKRQKKPKSRNARKKDLADIGSLSDSESSDSSEDFPALEPEVIKYNIGLDLKFNKTNMEVRGYTSKRDGQWFYSVNVVKLVNEFARLFPDVVDLLSRADRSKDVYNAADVFPNDPEGRTMEIVNWLEDSGVRSLPKIPTNCNVLDDDDIDSIWNYITDRPEASVQEVKKSWSARPNLLYKPGLDKGCIAPIPNAQFALLDRVICVDRGASIPLGLRGTVVGIQTPPKSLNDEEETFETISADATNSLIIMCDPATDIFDTPQKGKEGDLTELTGSLAKLLGVNGLPQQVQPGAATSSGITEEVKPKQKIKTRPKLVKLFPYQVLNLTQGARDIRQDLKKAAVPVQVNGKDKPLLNGTVIKSYADMAGSRQSQNARNSPAHVVKVLRNPIPATKATGGVSVGGEGKPKIPPLMSIDHLAGENVQKPRLPWPPQPMSGSITVEQLFAQAAKEQKVPVEKPKERRVVVVRKTVPAASGKEQSPSVPYERKEQRKPENNRKPVLKKREPAFEGQVQVKPEKEKEAKSTVRIFTNSAFQNKEMHRPQSEIRQGQGLVRKQEEKAHKPSQNNQLLNLLCQPRNLERVKSDPVQNHSPNSNQECTSNPLQELSMKLKQTILPQQQTQRAPAPQSQQRFVQQQQQQAVFSHPVFFNGHAQQQFYVPVPYPIAQGMNPGQPAFVSPHPNFVMYNQPGIEQMNRQMFMPPPPPPQHWTQNQSQNTNATTTSTAQKSLKGRNPAANVFVPLQVSRSMAGPVEGEQGQSQNGMKRPVVEAEIRPQVEEQVQVQIVGKMESGTDSGCIEDSAPVSSRSLKELLGLGVVSTEKPDSVRAPLPQPARKSRIAANFSIGPQNN